MNIRQQQSIATVLTTLLVIAIGLQLAWWSWHFIAPTIRSNAPSASTGAAFEAGADYKNKARQLFGGDGSSSAIGNNAPATQSDITLKGVFAVDGKTLSAAVVNLGGKDQVVTLNQELSNGAKLTEVHADYIVVSRAGVPEKIMLAEFRGARGTNASTTNAAANGAASTGAGFRLNVANAGTNSYSLSRQELNNVLQDPRQLEFLGRIGNAPNGGIRVDDAPANSLSAKLGLKAGDTIISVNSQPVSGTGDLARLYQQFATISQVRIEVKRGGAPMLLTYAVQN